MTTGTERRYGLGSGVRFFTIIAAVVAWSVVVGPSAKADFFNFDPDGPNNPNGTGSLPAVTISGFDQAVGNALAVGGNAAIQNFIGGSGSTTFDLYYQATLQGYSGGSPPSPQGLNSTFQITFSMKVHELVTGFDPLPGGGGVATFATAPVQDPSDFLRIYYNGAATTALGNGNLSGLTFQDGQVIFDGTPFAKPGGTGNFAINGNGSGGVLIDTFDKNGTNNYPGVNTVVGNGGAVVNVAVNAVDPTFFVSGAPFLELRLNSSLVVPFDTVDPSAQFRGKDSAAALGPTVPGSLVVPNIGSINGANGLDIQFQADANSSLTVVPEPSTIMLIGVGLLGAFGYGWRKRR